MLDNFTVISKALRTIVPGFDYSAAEAGPWQPLAAADTLRNVLLRRGMTNPNLPQTYKDQEGNEWTAGELLTGLGHVDAKNTAVLKVFDHALPWPADLRRQHAQRLEGILAASNGLAPDKQRLVRLSLLPAAAMWTRLPSLLTPARDRAGLSLLRDEVEHVARNQSPLLGIEDAATNWLYNMTTMDDSVTPQTCKIIIIYTLR